MVLDRWIAINAMTVLSDIPIHESPGPASTGNVLPILAQIRYALEKLVSAGESTLIDLRALPFGPGDEAELFGRLGRGEVSAELQALGISRIWETEFPGVWVVDHANPEGERLALHIEIAEFPALLRSQPEDMREALERLDGHLKSLGKDEE
jgi:hydrogenase-1 operon protein HyaF